jgi:hypothetical protein
MGTRALTDGGTPSEREIQNISVSVPDSTPISIEATVTRASITPKQTAHFEIAVTWNGDETQSISFGNEIPFSEPNYSTSANGLLLLSTDSGVERRNQDVWLPKTGDDGRLPTKQNLVVGELDPKETVVESWTVWGDPRYVSYIESGTYQFENSIGLGSVDSDTVNQISWTLTITIQ